MGICGAKALLQEREKTMNSLIRNKSLFVVCMHIDECGHAYISNLSFTCHTRTTNLLKGLTFYKFPDLIFPCTTEQSLLVRTTKLDIEE